MFDHHERTKIRVHAAIRSPRIRDQVSTVIDIRHRSAPGFMGPESVSALAEPVEINIRSDN